MDPANEGRYHVMTWRCFASAARESKAAAFGDGGASDRAGLMFSVDLEKGGGRD